MPAAILLFLLGIGGLIHTARSLSDGRFDYPIFSFASFALIPAISIITEGMKRRRFIQWLIDNRKEVSGLGALYEGETVTLRTELRVLYLAFSVVAFSFQIPSRYISSNLGSPFISVIFSMASAIFGWWGFPHGPLFTIQALTWNLKGGRTYQVWQFYQSLDRETLIREERQRLARRRFLSLELSPQHKVGLIVVILGGIMLIVDYVFRR